MDKWIPWIMTDYLYWNIIVKLRLSSIICYPLNDLFRFRTSTWNSTFRLPLSPKQLITFAVHIIIHILGLPPKKKNDKTGAFPEGCSDNFPYLAYQLIHGYSLAYRVKINVTKLMSFARGVISLCNELQFNR